VSATTWKSVLTMPVSPTRDHISGRADAPVTLVEYGDRECPFCAAAHPIVKAIEARAGEAIRFVLRHFPLTTMHPHAAEAAGAAAAAAAQGKFWAMHDTLYANHPRLDDQSLLGYAASFGLDVDRFSREVGGHIYLPRINEDFISGVRSGVNGTPSFFINGIRHDGGWDYASLMTAVQNAANETAAAGGRRRTERTRLGQLGPREAPDRASRQLVQKRPVGGGLIDQRLIKQG
jgi:protein-disulfide isomerase